MVTRIKKSFTKVPTNIESAMTFVGHIASKQIEINRLRKDEKTRIQAVQAEVAAKVAPLEKERDTLFNNLFAFAKPLQAILTAKARSIKTKAGTFGWRWTTPKVQVIGSEERLVERLLANPGTAKYVRVVHELNRDKLLAERPNIPGIEYTKREEFFATPKIPKGEGRAETVAIDV